MGTLQISSIFLFFAFVTVQSYDIKKLASINGEEKDALDELRRRVEAKITEPFMNDDWYLLRFLQARKYNVDKAELAFLNHVEWRNDHHFQNVHDEDWSEFERDYPSSVDGVDKEGRPIVTLDFGKWDITKKMENPADKERLIRYYNKILDEATRKVMLMQAEGKNVTKWMYLADMEGVSMEHHVNMKSAPWYWEVIGHLENFHPNMANDMMLLNCPTVLQYIMPTVRYILKSNTHLAELGGKDEWQSILENKVDADQLSPNYGGLKGVRPQKRPGNPKIVGTFEKLMNGEWVWGLRW